MSLPQSKTKISVKSPHIHVYYIRPSSTKSRFRLLHYHPAWLFIAVIFLVIGTMAGSWAVWSSRFGQADKTTDSPTEQLATKSPVPLSFSDSDLNIVTNLLPILIDENHYQPTEQELKDAERKTKLQQYLVKQRSPLAQDDAALNALLQSRNMKMILAISFVESNMCRHQAGFNCSGIGGSQLKHYANFAEWVVDFDNLLERRYKGLPVEKFIGYYVQPGSANWVDGVYQILGELSDEHIE